MKIKGKTQKLNKVTTGGELKIYTKTRERKRITRLEDPWDLTHRRLRTLQNTKEIEATAIVERSTSDT